MYIQLSLISKYRAELMGIATLGIIVCHCPQNNVMMPTVLKYAMYQGQFANALFLLLSGFGLYYSLSSNYAGGGGRISSWYKKRYIRVLVPYLLITLFPGVFISLSNPNTDWIHWLARLTLISYWKYHDCAWFLALLIPLYAITPLIYKSLFFNKRPLLNLMFYAIPLLLLPIIRTGNVIYDTILLHCPNILAFVVGLALGWYSKHHKTVNIFWFFACGVLFCLLFFVQHRNFATWYLGICFLLLPLLIIALEKINKQIPWLVLLGSISLESYLTNTTLPGYVKMIPWASFPLNINYGNYFGYMVIVVGGLLWAYIINKISKVIISKI